MIINNTTGEIMQGDLESKMKYDYAKNNIYMTPLDKTNRIEQVIKALGTMVLFPTEISDPSNIGGQKVYGQPVQRPILEGVNREKVLNKLVELITED